MQYILIIVLCCQLLLDPSWPYSPKSKKLLREKNWTPILHMPMYSSLNSDSHVFSAESLLEATT